MASWFQELGLPDPEENYPEPALEQAPEQAEQDSEPTPAEDEALDPDVQEATDRLQEVVYYQHLLTCELFDANPVADRVHARLRQFARTEIRAVVSGGSPRAANPAAAARLERLANIPEAQLVLLERLLGNLDETKVTVLTTMLAQIVANPKVTRDLLNPAIRRPAAPPPAASPPRQKPSALPAVRLRPTAPPAILKTPLTRRAPVVPTKKPRPTAPAQPTAPEGPPRTPTANLKSVTSKPMPTGEDFTTATQELSNAHATAGQRKMAREIQEGPRE